MLTPRSASGHLEKLLKNSGRMKERIEASVTRVKLIAAVCHGTVRPCKSPCERLPLSAPPRILPREGCGLNIFSARMMPITTLAGVLDLHFKCLESTPVGMNTTESRATPDLHGS